MDKNYFDLINYYTNIFKQEWIPLLQIKEEKSTEGIDDIFLISALIENDENEIKKYIESYEWGFSENTFGKSTFYKTGDEVYYVAGDIVNDKEYIVAYRTFNNYDPIIEINPKLIWYGNLIHKNGEYINPDNNNAMIKINNFSVFVKREYIRDFLAANNKILTICFDNRRYYDESSMIDFYKYYVKNNYNFILELSTGEYEEYNACSSLVGKIIIMPLSEPTHEDYQFFFEKDEYEDFIIGVDNDEKPVVYTCNGNKLADFFGNNSDAQCYFTPVYFKRSILDKYHNNPDEYTVGDVNIFYLEKWKIYYTINKRDFVVVWLGDLGEIPYSEQKYWRLYNKKPEGDIEEKFFRQQILNQWTDTILPERYIFNLIDKVNHIIESKYGNKLFGDLGEVDEKLKSAFSIPTNSSVTTFQNFLMQLNKITVERINTKLIKEIVNEDKLKDKKSGNLFGSRIQLNVFLEEIGLKSYTNLDKALKLSYNSRNKLAGHKGSIKEYNKVWKRDVKFKPDFISDSKFLLTGINNALSKIIKELQND